MRLACKTKQETKQKNSQENLAFIYLKSVNFYTITGFWSFLLFFSPFLHSNQLQTVYLFIYSALFFSHAYLLITIYFKIGAVPSMCLIYHPLLLVFNLDLESLVLALFRIHVTVCLWMCVIYFEFVCSNRSNKSNEFYWRHIKCTISRNIAETFVKTADTNNNNNSYAQQKGTKQKICRSNENWCALKYK